MLEFSGKNFQCWPDFKIKVDGLTLLVGPSNHGKSAIFRALKGVLRNEISQASVKDGTAQTDLHLVMDLADIEYHRSAKGSAKYKVNGKEFAKLAGGVPPAIDGLGFSQIEIGSFRFDPIFAGQFDTPFLLGAGPQELNAILGAFASTERLELGKKTAASRVATKNQEAKALASEIGDAELRRSRLEELKLQVEAIANTLPPLEKEASRLTAIDSQIVSALTFRAALNPLRDLISKVDLPDFQDAENTEARFQALETILGAKCALRQTRSALATLDEVAVVWSQIIADYRVYAQLNSALDCRRDTARETAKGINAVIGDVEDVLMEAADLQARIKALRDAILLWDIVDKAQREMTAASLEYGTAVDRVEDLEADIEEEARAAALVECPKCHHKFNPNQEHTKCQNQRQHPE